MRHTCGILLSLLLALALLTACGSGGINVQPDSQGDGEPAAGAPSAAKRTITDGAGRTVEIPAQVTRIVPLGNAPRMIVYLGLADRVVGIESCEIASSPIQAYAYAYREQWAALPVCGTNAMGEAA